MAVPQRPAEADVGISEYLAPEILGFTGRFKERWQDFHVYEVDAGGTELHLAELLTPSAVAVELRHAAAKRRGELAALGPGFLPAPEAKVELEAALGAAAAAELVEFLRRQRPPGDPAELADPSQPFGGDSSSGELAPPPFVDINASCLGDGSKDARKRAHQAVLNHFGSFLNTETVERDGGARCIRIWMREAERRAKPPRGNADGDSRTCKGQGGQGGKGKGKGKGRGKAKGKGGRGCSDPVSSGRAAEGSGEFGTFRHEGWPKDRPDYLYFRLYKENCDTGEAVAGIARCVGRSVKQFSYAGTKDRRAVTVQQICVHRLPADQLRRTVLHRLWDKRVRISNLEYRSDRLRLGVLQGNHFRIVLRSVLAPVAEPPCPSDSTVSRAFAAVSSRGFLNYYGLQRFGTREVRTHCVGAALIAGRWDEAIRLVLGDADIDRSGSRKRPVSDLGKGGRQEQAGAIFESKAKAPRLANDAPAEMAASGGGVDVGEPVPEREALPQGASNDREQPKWQVIREAQRIFLTTGDAQRALEAMPRSQHLDRCLLGALARKLQPAEALRQLPRQALSLYAHAAQSLIWNAVLSRRVRQYGAQPTVGDLVLATSDGDVATALAPDPPEDPMGGDCQAEPTVIGPEDGTDEDAQTDSWRLPDVRELTAEELGVAALHDVVLPLPGSDVRYPQHLRDVYEEVARDLLGLSLGDFHSSKLVPLPGSYRQMVVKPAGLKWRTVPAAEVRRAPHSALLESDVTRLLAQRSESSSANMDAAHDGQREADGAISDGGGSLVCRAGSEAASIGDGSTADSALAKDESQQAESDGTPGKSCSMLAGADAADVTIDCGAQEAGAVVFSCTLPPSAYLTMLLRELMKQSTASPHLAG
uniref:TRUD domain-containing protein n=1 Tax=Pyrodinium bahamense TaxID=73915 RepID=A0A7S0B4G5_9DINO|mmetsp:Transcript_48468/g.134769  ORF Transcript_48468/g.134769 Transcript_48468/m.134769 type:complete len:875 (+) Transcript_48468:72-2696(+)